VKEGLFTHQSLFLGRAQGGFGIDFGPNFCFRYVTSRTFRPQFGKILAFVTNGSEAQPTRFDIVFCMFRTDKPGTSTKIFGFATINRAAAGRFG
jgi:hypothetical protein